MMPPVVHAVIPSYRPDAAQLAALIEAFSIVGVEAVVVANGSAALTTCTRLGLPVLEPGHNAGFGPSIDWAVERMAQWDWLLLANDDLRVDPIRLGRALTGLGDGKAPELVHLDDDRTRAIPGVLDVLANLSLIARITERLVTIRHEDRPGYQSFSCVLISREAWRLTGGFDHQMPFTYEDADLVRRLLSAGGTIRTIQDAGVEHEGSKTSSRSVATVLPVATWSALRYSEKWSPIPHGVVRALVAVALVVRVTLVPFGRADRTAHLEGIRRSVRVALTGRRPRMPPY